MVNDHFIIQINRAILHWQIIVPLGFPRSATLCIGAGGKEKIPGKPPNRTIASINIIAI